jgi:GTP cyclohydrolase I
MQFLTRGYTEDAEALLKGALFTVSYDEMVIVKDVEMFSLCEHHMLPFFGKVHVAYIPNGKVIGLSKVPRLIELFSRRLQIQERLTTQIAETIQKVIEPQGVGVVIEARHLCMMMRGVEKQHSAAVTSSMLGCFREERNALRVPVADPPAPQRNLARPAQLRRATAPRCWRKLFLYRSCHGKEGACWRGPQAVRLQDQS